MREKLDNFLIWSQKYTKTDMKYAVKGGFWLDLGRLGLLFASFITLMAFSRFVSKETYGAYQYIISMIGLFSVFALPGINTSLIKGIVQKKEGTLRAGLKEKLKFSLGGCLILFAISGWYFIRGNNIFALAFLTAGLAFPFFESFSMFSAFWQAKKNFKKKSLYVFLSALFSAFFLIPIIYFTENIFYIVLVFLISHTLFDGIFLLKTLKKTKNKEIDKSALSFGKHLTLINAIPSFISHIDKVILWHFLGPIQVAVYSFAYNPITKIQGLFPVAELVLPKLGERNIKEIKKQVLEKMKKLFLLMIPIVIVFYFLSSFLYRIFFPEYLSSIIYFQVFILLFLLVPFQITDCSLIMALKKRQLYISNIVASLLKLILFLILIPLFNIWGAVLAIIFANASGNLINLYFFYKI